MVLYDSEVIDMRMRKKSWAEPFLTEHDDVVIASPDSLKGCWKNRLNKQNLHVEIGSGKGDYFTLMAELYPESGWVGIEKNTNVAAIAAKKAVESEHENQLLIAQDAEKISEWFADGEIDVIHLNFSDPWPKTGYKKRRLSHRRFLEVYEKLLCENGQIIMKTDNRKLFEFSLLEFAQCHFVLSDVSVDFRAEDHPEDVMTEYERKFVDLNQPIYRAVWTKLSK